MIDIQKDPAMHRVADRLRLVELPDYVNVDIETFKESGGPFGFASAADNSLPCGTKAACYISHAYFLAQKDELPEHTRQAVEQKLASFAELHGIRADVAKLAQYMTSSDAEETSVLKTAAQLTHQMPNLESCMPGDLIRGARELVDGDKTARDYNFCRQWCMDRAFANLPVNIDRLKMRSIPNETKEARAERIEHLDVLASKVSRISQTQQLRAIDTIADALHLIMGHKTASQTRDLLNDWPRKDVPDVRIGGVNVPYVKLESKLADISTATGLPLVRGKVVQLPAANWVDVIESCSPEQAQQIHSTFLR